jgi:large subunit ribosomal protein L5
METVKQKTDKIFDTLKEEFSYKNKMSAPIIEKVVISVGTGKKLKADKKINELISDRLSKITGQKPSIRPAKKSIAGFKLREGDPIGLATTLRGEKMYAFLDKLINIALPRTKDFRGINTTIVDQVGNATIGIPEHTIFPEVADEELRNVFGMAITIVTTAKSKEEARKVLNIIGIPFKKETTK